METTILNLFILVSFNSFLRGYEKVVAKWVASSRLDLSIKKLKRKDGTLVDPTLVKQ